MRTTLCVLVSCIVLLAGCGQKGPLYLPQDPALDNSAPSSASKHKPRDNSQASAASHP